LNRIKACQKPGRTKIKTGLEEMKAMDLEANPEVETMPEYKEVLTERPW
jgi:hypothetical protein